MRVAHAPQHMLEILRLVRAGKHFGGGDVPLATLQDEIDRLIALRQIEPDGATPYRLTTLGATVLDAQRKRTRQQS